MDIDGEKFFEGTEKLLEIWFSPSTSTPGIACDLRTIERVDWETLLQHVECEIISQKQDDDMTAYILSESSMFISSNRFILKTCGRTVLLRAVEPLLKLARTKCNLDIVDDLFYSRKKFSKPELQHKIHQSFEEEVVLLDSLFDNGAAYALGRLNGDCWYLYMIDNFGVIQPDQTLEILMQEIDQSMMQNFTMTGSKSAKEATVKSGIVDLLPGMIVDDFLFDPCGYSMNAILPRGQYLTIHITPEPHCSYVSIETNVAQESYQELILKILNVFNPGKFLLTVFANKSSISRFFYKELRKLDYFKGYMRSDHQFCQFMNYNLTYTTYTRPSQLGMPRCQSQSDTSRKDS